MRLHILLGLIFFCITTKPYAQFATINKTRIAIYQANTNEDKLKALLIMGRLKNSLPSDSIYHYANWIKQLATELNDKRSLAQAEYYLLAADMVQGRISNLAQRIESTPSFKNIKTTDRALYYKLQLLKANTLNRLNNLTGALDLQLKLLDEATSDGDINTQLFILNYIGATYLNAGKEADAQKTWQQALQIIADKNNPANNEIEAYLQSNLALYYFNHYKLNPTPLLSDSFLTAINNTIEVATRCEAMGVLAAALSIRGDFYSLTGDFNKGEKDIKEGLEIRKKIGDPLYIVNDFKGVASFYFYQKVYKKSITAAMEGIAVADSNHINGEKIQLIKILAAAQKATGNFEEYSSTLEQYIAAADSNATANSAEKIAAIQTKYEVQKKEALIAQQKLQLIQRQLWLYGAGLLAVLLLLFTIYRFKQYKRQQKINSELAVKDAEQNERRRIAADLHDNLGVQANAILYNSGLLITDAPANKVVTDLQETAKEMLLNLRETLWAMKTADVTANDLWLRIINFMKQMGRHYSAIDFKTAGEVPKNFIVPSNRALNIVLVVQETVNNAVKHAGATSITAVSKINDQHWEIEIKDDGKGFDMVAAADKADSYGLQNMRERAAAANFGYTVKTQAGHGTQVYLFIKAII
ncbi:MAG: hypothetical protein RL172_427 [Bacteroidota bacterium]|jgi:signal transduction histidine kinase